MHLYNGLVQHPTSGRKMFFFFFCLRNSFTRPFTNRKYGRGYNKYNLKTALRVSRHFMLSDRHSSISVHRIRYPTFLAENFCPNALCVWPLSMLCIKPLRYITVQVPRSLFPFILPRFICLLHPNICPIYVTRITFWCNLLFNRFQHGSLNAKSQLLFSISFL